jgi:predicted DNA-binding transcriptional regulator YafY
VGTAAGIGVPASEQFTRIVQLVAELSRRTREGDEAATLSALAESFDVTPQQITADLRTLTLLGDHSDAEWLLSLSAWQQGAEVAISSAGPFRRPVRLTPEELLALRVALATEPESEGLGGKLALPVAHRGTEETLAEGVSAGPHTALPPYRLTANYHDRLFAATAEHRRVRLIYAGEGEREGREWVVQPHQLFGYRGHTYVVAWCEGTRDWRRFRLDRMLDVAPLDDGFAPRGDFMPVEAVSDAFRAPPESIEEVRVRFSADIARWVRERYPALEVQGDGSVVVTLRVSSVEWLVRRVLEYGAAAEVLEPAMYREAVKRAVTAVRAANAVP